MAEHALRKRMVVGSIPTGGFRLSSNWGTSRDSHDDLETRLLLASIFSFSASSRTGSLAAIFQFVSSSLRYERKKSDSMRCGAQILARNMRKNQKRAAANSSSRSHLMLDILPAILPLLTSTRHTFVTRYVLYIERYSSS